jgi:hypothetical protein
MAKTDPKAQRKVKQVMHEFKEGELKSGKSGRQVTNPKQAVAIGLSEARRAGAKVPKPKQRANAPLADEDTASVAGEEDPGASLDTSALSPAPAPESAEADTSRVRTPRRG